MRMITRLLNATFLTLVFFICGFANGRVETVRFQSKLIVASLPYNAILPQQIPHILESAAQKLRMPSATKRAAGA